MAPLLPRLRRRLAQNRWISIGEASSTEMTYPQVTMSATVEGPPNFLDPNVIEEESPSTSPPPTYTQVRNAARPEIARLIPNRGQALATTMPQNVVSREQNAGGAGLTSSNLTDLNDIRHEEAGNHLHMQRRISAVPQYPEYVEQPPGGLTDSPSTSTSGSRQPRKPLPTASTSTTAVYLAVAQLPGADPVDIALLPSADVQQPAPSKASTPLGRSLSSPSSSVGVSAAVSGPVALLPDPTIAAAGNVSEISWFWDDLCQEYWKPPDRGYYAPQARSTFRHTRPWPNRTTDAIANERSRHATWQPLLQRQAPAVSENQPPPPPPKDPGYTARPRRLGRGSGLERLRRSSSSPHLRNVRGDDDQREESNGFDAQARPSTSLSAALASRRSQVVEACARLLSRSLPRAAQPREADVRGLRNLEWG